MKSNDRYGMPVLVGQNGRGQWVVLDKLGRRGGIFANRTEALKFAEHSSPQPSVAVLSGTLELDFSEPPAAPDGRAISETAQRKKVA